MGSHFFDRSHTRIAGLMAVVAFCGAMAISFAHANVLSETSGENAITAGELRRHVAELASDRYQGRATLTPGAGLARDYLAARFAEYGLSPLPGQKRFLLDYALYETSYDPSRTRVVTREGALGLGADFVPFPFSDEGEVSADVVFTGYGITAPEHSHDDYEGLDVKGKIVLILRHTPMEGDSRHPLTGSEHAFFVTKARNAKKHGAVGMMLVTDPRYHWDNEDMRLHPRLSLKPERKRRRGSNETVEDFLAVHVSQRIAEKLVASTGQSLIEIQTALDEGVKADRFVISEETVAIGIGRGRPKKNRAQNVVGIITGSDLKLKREWVVIGAHYDHLGSYEGEGDTIFNGADDNASGTAGVLALARAFRSMEPPRRSIAFVGFSGEENGLLGSKAFVEEGILPLEDIALMVNLDMIGRNPGRPVRIFGDGFATGLRDAVRSANEGSGNPVRLGGRDYSGNSDHHPFRRNGVPFLFFTSGAHEDYHKVTDHADKLVYERMEKTMRLVYRIVNDVSSGNLTPRPVQHLFWLGASIEIRGEKGAEAAVWTEVQPGSRAAKADIRSGDVLRAVGGEPLREVRKAAERLHSISGGSTLDLTLQRGLEEVIARVEKPKKGYLGVHLGRLDREERRRLGLADREGVRILRLDERGPAQRSRVEAGDILVSLGENPVNHRSIHRYLERFGAGENVTLTLIRGSGRLRLELTLGERPDDNT